MPALDSVCGAMGASAHAAYHFNPLLPPPNGLQHVAMSVAIIPRPLVGGKMLAKFTGDIMCPSGAAPPPAPCEMWGAEGVQIR